MLNIAPRFLRPMVPAGLAALALTAGCGDNTEAPTAPEHSVALASTAPLSFIAVSAGASHTCGITTSQLAYCWGDNEAGELGTQTNTPNSSKPVPVDGNLKFVQISAGTEFTCGITTTSFAYCWGHNGNGQLGVPFNTHFGFGPVAVDGAKRRFSQIRAGFNHTCAITPYGVGFCWGKNQFGQLGANSTVASSNTPLRVAGGYTWNRIVAGGHYSCGITTDHLAYCWGNNYSGQVGNGTTNKALRKPVAVHGGLYFQLIVAGGGGYDELQNEVPVAAHTCGVTTDDKGYCWGDGPWELGAGPNPGGGLTPTLIAGNRRWGQVIAGWIHTCGVTSAKEAFCWGDNTYGQNGDGTTSPSNVPVPVAGSLTFAAVTTGTGPTLDAHVYASHSCGLTSTKRVYCWGDNQAGQLGDGTNTQRLTPVAVVGP